MDNHECAEHQDLIAHSKQAREDSRELIANARATVARSRNIIRRIRQRITAVREASEIAGAVR